MTTRRAIAALALCGLTAAACSGADATTSGRHSATPTPTTSGCVAPGGGRCAGPAPVDSALLGQLYIASRTQLALYGKFLCGGHLRVRESDDRIMVTYIASRVPAGAMTCARVTLSVKLAAPLAGRTVVDSVTGDVLAVGVLPNA